MLAVRARRQRGYLILELEGHAEFGQRGHDIVCAAATAIINAALLGLEAVAKSYPDHIAFELTEDDSDTSDPQSG